MRLHKFHSDDRINAKRAQAAKLERITEKPCGLSADATIGVRQFTEPTTQKVIRMLAYEDKYWQGGPQTIG